MNIGVPKESAANEARVALVPDAIKKLRRLEIEVRVERGAGSSSGVADADYEASGATLVDRETALGSDVVVAVNVPPDAQLKRGAVLMCLGDPHGNPDRIHELASQGVSCIALELIPRISRAQSMDVLSSMSNLAGYKAAVLAADHLQRIFPLMMTAAGTVRPAKIFVIGTGVAGLQAIATAGRLGAVVEAYDIRPDTKEEVESLGARFIEFDLGAAGTQDSGGYAKELTAQQRARQAELMTQQIQSADVVITTALVPGRKAPLLIQASVVEGMQPRSVIVDMAAGSGGNCELSAPDQVVERHGVTIIGMTNLPAELAQSSSQLYANNLTNLLKYLLQDGELRLDREDEIVSATLVCHEGEVTNDRIKEALTCSI